MKDLQLKFRKIYLPLFLTQVSSIVIYSVFHWLILGLQLKDSLLNIFLPLIVSGLATWFYLRKRLKLLKIINEKNIDFFSFLSWLAIAVPLIISQIYIENKNANLTEIRNISDIDFNKTTELYSIQNALVNKENYKMWVERSFKGKYQEKIVIRCYYMCPLIDDLSQHLNLKESRIWIGVSFSEDFSNRVFENKEKQNKAINNFISSTPELYKNHKFQTNYLKNLIRDDDFNSYFYLLKRQLPEIKKNDVLILKEPSATAKSKASANSKWFFRIFMGGNLIWLILIVFSGVDKKELTKFNKKQKKAFSWKSSVQDYIWIKAFWGTSILIAINLFLFVFMYLADINFNNSYDLLRWGAISDKSLINEEWWRLFTSIFLHGGFVHLIYNMVILVFLGCLIESILGTKKFLILYLLCGISASLITLLFKSNYVEAGASGAIFGLCGIYFGLTLIRYIEKNFLLVLISIFVILNILFSLRSGISMSSHLGGLISGVVITLIYFPLEKQFNQNV